MKKSVEIELGQILRENNWKSIEDIDWYILNRREDLTVYFVNEFKDRLNLDLMLELENISKELYNELTNTCTSFKKNINNIIDKYGLK